MKKTVIDYPILIQEWDYEKNEISPDKAFSGSAKKVWWLCNKKHSYLQAINYRTKKYPNRTCPFCSNQKLLKGFNDLGTTHKYILKEWDYEKNNILPEDITVGSHIKIWWKCSFGHSYQALPYNRCGKTHSGCPICDKENHTSFPEQAILYYLKKYYSNVINSNKKEIGMELDIYLPNERIAIEYDGKNWHNKQSIEQKKNLLCLKNNIKLIRIREKGLDIYDNCICIVRKDNRSTEDLSNTIIELFKILNIDTTDINIDKDEQAIYSSYIETRKNKNLLKTYPIIAEDWDYDKNGELEPTMVAPSSNKKVWWKCPNGHPSYNMSIQDRTNQKCGCPVCSGKKVIKGFNDLKTNYPLIVNEWDYDKNDILPDEVSSHSDKRVWWKCKVCGNSWQTKIDTRTRSNSGCPICGRKKADLGRSKSVKCIETGKTYKSLIDAEIQTGINRMCIGNCCKGKQKTAGKKHWEYL